MQLATAAPQLRSIDGTPLALASARFLDRADQHDRVLLEGLAGPVLDVGCGPGRIVAELTSLGVESLGIDISGTAVAEARRRGGEAAECCALTGAIPDVGRWTTALLLDGNIGIGGDPAALVQRLLGVVGSGGSVVAELEPSQVGCRGIRARFDFAGEFGPEFDWALVGPDGATTVAARAGATADVPFWIGPRCFVRFFRA